MSTETKCRHRLNGLCADCERISALERELAYAQSEVVRLKAGGCARDQAPRVLVREWRKAHGERDALKAENEKLRGDTFSLAACEKNNAELAAENDRLTSRLKAWRECAEKLADCVTFHLPPRRDDFLPHDSAALSAFDRLKEEDK